MGLLQLNTSRGVLIIYVPGGAGQWGGRADFFSPCQRGRATENSSFLGGRVMKVSPQIPFFFKYARIFSPYNLFCSYSNILYIFKSKHYYNFLLVLGLPLGLLFLYAYLKNATFQLAFTTNKDYVLLHDLLKGCWIITSPKLKFLFPFSYSHSTSRSNCSSSFSNGLQHCNQP